VFAAAALACILPVTIRNAVVGKDLVAIAWSDGMNFYIGNNPESNGVRAVLPGARADWWGGYDDARRKAEDAMGRPLPPSQVSQYWYRRGSRFWREETGAAVSLTARKLALVLGNAEPSNDRQLYFRRRHSTILRSLPLGFAPILGLSILGTVSLARRIRRDRHLHDPVQVLPLVFAVPYLLGVVAFFVTSRYRLPVVAFLIPLAAFAVDRLVSHARARRWRTTALSLGGLGSICVFSSLNPFGIGALSEARGRYDLAVDYAPLDPHRALEEFDRAIAGDSAYAPAWRGKGRTLDEMNRLDAAREAVITACRLDPRASESFFLLGKVSHRLSRYDEALRAYQSCVSLDPLNKYAWSNMADICFRIGAPDSAGVYLKQALRIDPAFPNARFGMAYLIERGGFIDSAMTLYSEIRDYPPARFRLQLLSNDIADTLWTTSPR
jgi:tetratricopeptide (TPR) repeat protein